MNKRRIVIFCAGPFRAETAWEIEENVREAERAALAVWRAGFTAICPPANSRFFQGCLPDEAFLDGYLEVVGRCDGLYSYSRRALESAGATAELDLAYALDMPVFGSIDEMTTYYKNTMDGNAE